jgi:hypothetical protein
MPDCKEPIQGGREMTTVECALFGLAVVNFGLGINAAIDENWALATVAFWVSGMLVFVGLA